MGIEMELEPLLQLLQIITGVVVRDTLQAVQLQGGGNCVGI